MFCKKDVLRNFAKFTGKHLCQSLFLNKVAGLRAATLLKKRLWHRHFPVNFAKFLKTPFLTEHLRWLLPFKGGNNLQAENYRPISVLPVFPKTLEKIMYNRIYNYFVENKLLFPKQFGFQINTSTEHAILNLVRNITKSFEKNEYVLGVFIDRRKAFDTIKSRNTFT